MSAHDKITPAERYAIRKHMQPLISVSLSEPLPLRLDAATMAAVALGRVPPFTPSGAQVAK